MAPKKLLPVAALCSALATGHASRRLGDTSRGGLLTDSPKPRASSAEYHCMQAVFTRTGNDLDLGVPLPRNGRLDSRGYRTPGQGKWPPGGSCHLHMEIGCDRHRWRLVRRNAVHRHRLDQRLGKRGEGRLRQRNS